MESNLVIGIVVAIFALAVIGRWSQNKIIWYIAKSGMVSVMLIVGNYLLPQFAVGINIYTVGFSTLFGMPGVMSLYLFRIIA